MRYINRWTPQQLAGDWKYVYSGYLVRTVGGRQLYDDVTLRRSGQYVLRRLETLPNMKLRTVYRWIDSDTPLELVKAKRGE